MAAHSGFLLRLHSVVIHRPRTTNRHFKAPATALLRPALDRFAVSGVDSLFRRRSAAAQCRHGSTRNFRASHASDSMVADGRAPVSQGSVDDALAASPNRATGRDRAELMSGSLGAVLGLKGGDGDKEKRGLRENQDILAAHW
jgi:hypothetical protein